MNDDDDDDDTISVEEKSDLGDDDIEDYSLNDPRQVVARNRLIKVFRTIQLKKVRKGRKTNKSVRLLHENC